MNPTWVVRFERLAHRLSELESLLSDPGVTKDVNRYRSLSREQAEAAHVLGLYRQYRAHEADAQTAQDLLQEAQDQRSPPDQGASDGDDMVAMAKEEWQNAQEGMARLHTELQLALLPQDPKDERNAFVEIRAGTGGDESALFAADLARMYLRYAERKGWRCEVMSESPSDLGGFKEWIARFEGDKVYGRLRYESGGHRVQRIPVTETQGRIHTSACTVAILPEPDPTQAIVLQPSDLRIDTFRASGAGGQHVNKTDSAIRITHLPTGLVAECQDDRSQHRNKAKAMMVLQARLEEMEQRKRDQEDAATRKGLIGTGDRSDRIRTYNFPQGRLTDHRIGLTLYKLNQVVDGDLDDVFDALQSARAAEQLAALESGG